MNRNPAVGHEEEIQGHEYSEKLDLTGNLKEEELQESDRVLSISRDAAKKRRSEYRRISVERKNRSYDESCSKHTCSLAMDRENHKHSCYRLRSCNKKCRRIARR